MIRAYRHHIDEMKAQPHFGVRFAPEA